MTTTASGAAVESGVESGGSDEEDQEYIPLDNTEANSGIDDSSSDDSDDEEVKNPTPPKGEDTTLPKEDAVNKKEGGEKTKKVAEESGVSTAIDAITNPKPLKFDRGEVSAHVTNEEVKLDLNSTETDPAANPLVVTIPGITDTDDWEWGLHGPQGHESGDPMSRHVIVRSAPLSMEAKAERDVHRQRVKDALDIELPLYYRSFPKDQFGQSVLACPLLFLSNLEKGQEAFYEFYTGQVQKRGFDPAPFDKIVSLLQQGRVPTKDWLTWIDLWNSRELQVRVLEASQAADVGHQCYLVNVLSPCGACQCSKHDRKMCGINKSQAKTDEEQQKLIKRFNDVRRMEAKARNDQQKLEAEQRREKKAKDGETKDKADKSNGNPDVPASKKKARKKRKAKGETGVAPLKGVDDNGNPIQIEPEADAKKEDAKKEGAKDAETTKQGWGARLPPKGDGDKAGGNRSWDRRDRRDWKDWSRGDSNKWKDNRKNNEWERFHEYRRQPQGDHRGSRRNEDRKKRSRSRSPSKDSKKFRSSSAPPPYSRESPNCLTDVGMAVLQALSGSVLSAINSSSSGSAQDSRGPYRNKTWSKRSPSRHSRRSRSRSPRGSKD